MYHHDEDDVHNVFDALVELTGYDSFAESNLEVYYGCDYEHHVHDGIVNEIADWLGLKVWYVRNILIDDIPEVREMHGKWCMTTPYGMKEFADVEEV
jgi:hypothetical protein